MKSTLPMRLFAIPSMPTANTNTIEEVQDAHTLNPTNSKSNYKVQTPPPLRTPASFSTTPNPKKNTKVIIIHKTSFAKPQITFCKCTNSDKLAIPCEVTGFRK